MSAQDRFSDELVRPTRRRTPLDEEVSKIANKTRKRELVIFDLDDTLIFTNVLMDHDRLTQNQKKQLKESGPKAYALLAYAVEKYKDGNAIVAIVTNGHAGLPTLIKSHDKTGAGWVQEAFQTFYADEEWNDLLTRIIVLFTHELIDTRGKTPLDCKLLAYKRLKEKLESNDTLDTPWNVIAFGDDLADIEAARLAFGRRQVVDVKFKAWPRRGQTNVYEEDIEFFDRQLEQAVGMLEKTSTRHSD